MSNSVCATDNERPSISEISNRKRINPLAIQSICYAWCYFVQRWNKRKNMANQETANTTKQQDSHNAGLKQNCSRFDEFYPSVTINCTVWCSMLPNHDDSEWLNDEWNWMNEWLDYWNKKPCGHTLNLFNFLKLPHTSVFNFVFFPTAGNRKLNWKTYQSAKNITFYFIIDMKDAGKV